MRTRGMQRVEEEWGEPLSRLLPRLLNEGEGRTTAHVARILGVAPSTLLYWMRGLGVERVWTAPSGGRRR